MKRALEGGAPSGRHAVGASREAADMGAGEFKGSDLTSGLGDEGRSQVKHLEGKTFYLRDDVWWDSTVDMEAERVKVKYLSDQYFELLKKTPEAGRYLALGERVVFVLDGKTYEVTE